MLEAWPLVRTLGTACFSCNQERTALKAPYACWYGQSPATQRGVRIAAGSRAFRVGEEGGGQA